MCIKFVGPKFGAVLIFLENNDKALNDYALEK